MEYDQKDHAFNECIDSTSISESMGQFRKKTAVFYFFTKKNTIIYARFVQKSLVVLLRWKSLLGDKG